MIKPSFLLLFCCLCFQVVLPNNKKETKTIRKNSKIENLKSAYAHILNSQNLSENEKSFFYNFPNTFQELIGVFGDTATKDPNRFLPSPLYNTSFDFIKMFFALKTIDPLKKVTRIINISLKGKWDADAVNYFKEGLRLHFKENNKIYIQLLSNKNDRDIYLFWYFFFDNPHPEEKLPEELLHLNQSNNRIYTIMLKAHNKVLLDNKGSH